MRGIIEMVKNSSYIVCGGSTTKITNMIEHLPAHVVILVVAM